MSNALGVGTRGEDGLTLTVELSDEQLDVLAQHVGQLLSKNRDDGFLDSDGAADYLALTRSAVYHLVERRQLPHHRAGGRLLFDKAELRRWVEQRPTTRTAATC